MAVHIKQMLKLHGDFQEFLERMATKLEENLVEVDAGSTFYVDESVYVDYAFARIAYCIKVLKNIKTSNFNFTNKRARMCHEGENKCQGH